MTTTTKTNYKPQVQAARWLALAILLIFAGFLTDGITEYGHHALFIISGICIGVGIGKLK